MASSKSPCAVATSPSARCIAPESGSLARASLSLAWASAALPCEASSVESATYGRMASRSFGSSTAIAPMYVSSAPFLLPSASSVRPSQ